MSTLDSPEMMRAVIMDHYEYPRNKKLKGDSRYFKVHMDSESCIHDIYIEALIEEGVIKDDAMDTDYKKAANITVIAAGLCVLLWLFLK